MSTFNPGDVVRLKSGGPKMTVRNKKVPHVARNGQLAQAGYGLAPAPCFDRPVTCDWFGEPPGQSVSHFSETFEEEQLTAAG